MTLLVPSTSLNHPLILVSMVSHEYLGPNPTFMMAPSLYCLWTHSLLHNHQMMGFLEAQLWVPSFFHLCFLLRQHRPCLWLHLPAGLSHELTLGAGRNGDLIMGEGSCFLDNGKSGAYNWDGERYFGWRWRKTFWRVEKQKQNPKHMVITGMGKFMKINETGSFWVSEISSYWNPTEWI